VTASRRPLPEHPALLPGARCVRRQADQRQVDAGPGRAAVLPEHPEVLALLAGLAGRAPLRRPTAGSLADRCLHLLHERRLLVDAEEYAAARRSVGAATADAVFARDPDRAAARLRARADATVGVQTSSPESASLVHGLLRAAGVTTSSAADPAATVALLISADEPDRPAAARLVTAGTSHLLVRPTTDGALVGPFVEPGRTACLGCWDAHLTDRDPKHPVVTHQLASLPGPPADPLAWQSALAHAVADVVRHVDGVDGVDGERPRSWSSLLAVGADGSLARQQVRRHPACACCAEAHHHSESSLPSIARRLSREQVSQ